MEEKFTYDDVLLVPQYSEVMSRSNVSTHTELGRLQLPTPVISSNMDTITGKKMMNKMDELGGLGIYHRGDIDIEASVRSVFESWPSKKPNLALSIGSMYVERELRRMNAVFECIKKFEYPSKDLIICVDFAHGDSKASVETISELRKRGFEGFIIGGTVCTPDACKRLLVAGANAVRVGIGGGCFSAKTRVLMANGSYKNIEDVILHDRVINMNGNPVEVIGTSCKGTREVIRYKSMSFYKETTCTSDHQHFVKESDNLHPSIVLERDKGFVKKLENPKYKWKKIDNLDKGVLTYPAKISFELPSTFNINLKDFVPSGRALNQGTITLSNIKPSYELGYLFGTFLANGVARRNHVYEGYQSFKPTKEYSAMTWYLGLHDGNVAIKIKNCLMSVFESEAIISKKRKDALMVSCREEVLAYLFEGFEKRDGRHLPSEYICSDKDYLRGILEGLVDSCEDNNGYLGTRLESTNAGILELHSFLCLNLNGSLPLQKFDQSYVSRIDSDESERLGEEYKVITLDEIGLNDSRSQIINATEECLVYDIEVDCDTHSFIANNVIVHNSGCSTRIKTGVGYPQLSAVYECARTAIPIIADGGIRTPSDAAKALAAGAKAVMIGGMMSGTDCVPGWEKSQEDGSQELEYRGMASNKAKVAVGLTEGFEEGVSVRVIAQKKGSTEKVIRNLMDGLRSAMSYSNAHTMKEFRQNSEFVKVTSAVVGENKPHILDRVTS